MSLANMKVFNQYLMEATAESLAQSINKFNAASNGAISLTALGFDGDFFQTSFYSALHTAQRRVDRYAAQSAAAATALAQLQENSVKVAGGFGPIVFEPGQLTWMQKNEAEAIAVISQQLAEAIIADQLNSGIAAAVAAISNVPGATNDVSATLGISYTALNDAHALFGDQSGLIIANVMDGVTYHKFIGQNIANAGTLFDYQGVRVVDILGRRVVVTDAPALRESPSTAANDAKVLGLVQGAATVYDGSDLITNISTTNGLERIATTFQTDYTFGLALKGFAWDTANGGKSPTDAEIATGSNWDKVATSWKHTAGVMVTGITTSS